MDDFFDDDLPPVSNVPGPQVHLPPVQQPLEAQQAADVSWLLGGLRRIPAKTANEAFECISEACTQTGKPQLFEPAVRQAKREFLIPDAPGELPGPKKTAEDARRDNEYIAAMQEMGSGRYRLLQHSDTCTHCRQTHARVVQFDYKTWFCPNCEEWDNPRLHDPGCPMGKGCPCRSVEGMPW